MAWTEEAKRNAAATRAKKEEKPNGEVSHQKGAIEARWAAERGSEEEVRKYFRRQVSIDEGLALLARMRENCKIASYELNDRITRESDKDRCKFCGGPKKSRRQWALVRPYRDPTTQLIRNDYFCSIECVALMNRRNQGVYGVPDQGMTQAMNPRNHPREFTEEEAQKIEEAQEANVTSSDDRK